MDHSERGSHAQSVYPARDISHMETATVKEEEEANTRKMVRA